MIHRMVDRGEEDIDPPLAPLVVCVRSFFERLGKQRVTPIIRSGKSELKSDVMGGGFPAIYRAQISAGPRIIATPLLYQTL